MNPGTSIRVVSKCIGNGRTGVVTGISKFQENWWRVEFDPKPPYPTWGLFPAEELVVDKTTVREPAQASLWGGP